MSKHITIDTTCIYCNTDVCDCPSRDYSLQSDYACTETNRGTKQYFHISCVMRATKTDEWPEVQSMYLIPKKKKRSLIYDQDCPFCGEYIHYWPNCSPRTCSDYGNVGWVQTKSGIKLFTHLSCFRENTRRIKNEINN